jgi:serine/threonine-protein kinase
VLAFKMLTAKLPFEGEPLQQLKQHLLSPPPSPGDHVPNLPPPVSQLVQRMMAKEPEQRPTLDEMRALFAALREGRLTLMPGTAPVRMPAHPGLHTQQVAAAMKRPTTHFVLLALGVVAAGAVAFAIVHAIS